MKRKFSIAWLMKRRFILIGVVALLVVVGIFVWQRTTTSATRTSASVQTTTVKRGSLAATVNAAGNISAPRQVALAFSSSGRVAKVNVRVGDVVTKDQVLMELDSTDLTLALKTAQANLTSAKASYDQTKADLQFTLRNTQASFESAKANLDAAKASNAQNPNSLIVAKANLDTATITVQKAQADYDVVAWRGDVGMTSQSAALQTATIAYQSALASYKIAAAKINDADLKAAQASYTNAQTGLEQAQKNIETKLATAQASLDTAQVSAEIVKRNLDNAKLVAPFDGAVSVVNYGVGDTATSTAATVVDLSQLQVKVTVAEVDIAKLKVGATATMTIDALAGKTYSAEVIAVSPVGTVTSGVVNYSAILQVTDSDGAIKPGMTANLNIEVERRDDVLIVPTRAIRSQGNQKLVTVLYKGQSIQMAVGTGLSNEQSIEITNGLKEGDVVVITQTTTRTTTNIPGGTGIPGLGGPPR